MHRAIEGADEFPSLFRTYTTIDHLGGTETTKAPHADSASIVGGAGDASRQGGHATEKSHIYLPFVGCPLKIATQIPADRAAKMQKNRENRETQGSI